MTTTLVVGTRNKKKLEELRDLLQDLPLQLLDLSSFPTAPEVEEDGKTFEANAAKKATEVARAIQQWVLAEDSGLVVPALGGQPGVYSARFAGKQGDDEANNALLLQKLGPLPESARGAYYVCVAV